MKKILFLFLLSGLLFACTNSTTETKETTKDTTAKDTTNPNAPASTNAEY